MEQTDGSTVTVSCHKSGHVFIWAEDASLDEEELLSDCRSCTRSSREISLPQSRGFFPIEASVRSVWDWDGWSGVLGLQTILGWLSVIMDLGSHCQMGFGALRHNLLI
jgi:hypothetical protein